MTGDPHLLGIANDRANWSLRELDTAPIVLLWRTDGPGHHVVVCNLNGWHAGLYQTIDPGAGLDDPAEERLEAVDDATPPRGLAVPVQIALAVDPAEVADLVEQLQRTSESIAEPNHR